MRYTIGDEVIGGPVPNVLQSAHADPRVAGSPVASEVPMRVEGGFAPVLPTADLLLRLEADSGVTTTGGGGADSDDVEQWDDPAQPSSWTPVASGEPSYRATGGPDGADAIDFGAVARQGAGALQIAGALRASAGEVHVCAVYRCDAIGTTRPLLDCGGSGFQIYGTRVDGGTYYIQTRVAGTYHFNAATEMVPGAWIVLDVVLRDDGMGGADLEMLINGSSALTATGLALASLAGPTGIFGTRTGGNTLSSRAVGLFLWGADQGTSHHAYIADKWPSTGV